MDFSQTDSFSLSQQKNTRNNKNELPCILKKKELWKLYSLQFKMVKLNINISL